MYSRRLFVVSLCALAACPLAGQAAGGLGLSDTRLIMADGRSTVAIVMNNSMSIPFLTKAWVEDLHGNKTEDVMVVPPVLLSVPGKFSRFQVSVVNPQNLPRDQESLFYLHTHSAPGDGNPNNALSVAYNSRLKVFYRPRGLSGNMARAIETLEWKLKDGVLTAINNSNFHISIVTIGLDKHYKQLSNFVIAPKKNVNFKVTHKYPKEVTVRWAAMDDFGSARITSRTISNE